MIRETRTVQYQVECDQCGVWGPRFWNETEARAAALEEGWSLEEQWNGLANIATHLCPSCEEKEEPE